MVLAQAYLNLDEEEGLIDRMQQQILIPRLGLKMTFRNHQQRVDDVSHEHGTIYAKIKEEDNSTCTQFEAVATNITGVMYIDKTPEHENNHQDVLVLNLDN